MPVIDCRGEQFASCVIVKPACQRQWLSTTLAEGCQQAIHVFRRLDDRFEPMRSDAECPPLVGRLTAVKDLDSHHAESSIGGDHVSEYKLNRPLVRVGWRRELGVRG